MNKQEEEQVVRVVMEVIQETLNRNRDYILTGEGKIKTISWEEILKKYEA